MDQSKGSALRFLEKCKATLNKVTKTNFADAI